MVNTELHLRIADLVIQVRNRSELPMLLEEGYVPFICEPAAEHMTVIVHAGLPAPSEQTTAPHYSATMDGHRLWEIAECEGKSRFTVYDPELHGTVNQVAFADTGFRHWDIHCRILEHDGEQGICPLLYPMGPLLMYHLSLNHDALLVHGSAIHDGELGRIFIGFSGVGKSTLARIWKENGAMVINDDRLIIRRQGDGYVVYNTPMFYADEPRQALLHAIFLPYHSPENRIRPLIGAEAAAQILAFCIQHGYDRAHVEHRLACVDRLCASVPVHSLGVVPNADIIPFIREHEHHR